MDERLEADLRYHHLSKHLRTIHGDGIAPGTKNRRHLSEGLHTRLHAEGCGHSHDRAGDGLDLIPEPGANDYPGPSRCPHGAVMSPAVCRLNHSEPG